VALKTVGIFLCLKSFTSGEHVTQERTVKILIRIRSAKKIIVTVVVLI